jgi:mRNA-degrading endonuclease toxin of MazEF toxin-antitoxin module
VIDVRSLVTVAEITTSMRGLAVEVLLDDVSVGLDRESTINCDGIHTVARSSLTGCVGVVDQGTMDRVCAAVGYALGC